ncbi:MAG: metal-dependent transcriptional regulator [Candidatus Methanomethylicia archaeon]
MHISIVEEEYLESIWKLERKYGLAKTTDLAKMLNVTLGTVSKMVKILEKKKFIIHEYHKGVKLTSKGVEVAIDVVRRHRLSERLLTDLLQVDWCKAHDEACRLEHGLSKYVTDLIEKALKNPNTCPHGNPIPKPNGELDEIPCIQLSNLSLGDTGVIVNITDESFNILKYAKDIGLTPGSILKVIDKIPFDNLLIIDINGITRTLGPTITSSINVRKMIT